MKRKVECTVVGKISTQNSEPRVPFSSLFLTAKNVEVSPGTGWACQGTNTRQSPAWGSSTPEHAQKRRRGKEMDEDFLVQKSMTLWPEIYSPLWVKCFSLLFLLCPFFFVARFPVGENTRLLPCGSNNAQGASSKRGPDLLALFERRDVYPRQTKRQLRKVGHAEGVLCLSSCQQTQQLQTKLSLQDVGLVVFLNLARRSLFFVKHNKRTDKATNHSDCTNNF